MPQPTDPATAASTLPAALRPLARLRTGDTVAIVAPAGPPRPERVARVAALFESQGLRARVLPGCEAAAPPAAPGEAARPAPGQPDYLAAPDATRLASLRAALADPTVAALHAVRGGYGCMRLLPDLPVQEVRAAGKLLIGYSDLTALHALWCAAGVPSLHAPMPASDLLRPEPGFAQDAQALFDLLRGPLRAGHVLAPPLAAAPRAAGLHRGGRARGRLIGGNLTLISALLGTPWAWPADGALLFVEEVNEEPYGVDRLLTHLHLAGVLQRLAGVVVGSFTQDADPAADGRDVWPVLADRLLPLGIPVLAGWPAGHGTPNRPLPLGVTAQLDADAGTLTLADDVWT